MAMRFVFAIAADREIALVGERREQFDRVTVFGSRHFSPVFLEEGCPLRGRLGLMRELHRFEARRQVGEPHVVPVPRSELGLWHAARRTADCADASAFILHSFATEPDNTYDHLSLLGMPPTFDIRGALARPA